MILRTLDRKALRYIAGKMRKADADEIYNVIDPPEPDYLVDLVMSQSDLAWMGLNDMGMPVVALGATETHRGLFDVWMFATDRLTDISVPFHRAVKRWYIPLLFELGARRLQCRSAESHVEAHRWLEALGAKREGELAGYGKNGQTYYLYGLSR